MSGHDTPTCPVCEAKFSFKGGICNKCGVPSEIAHMGPLVIARWKRRVGIKKPIGASMANRSNKHGRKGVKK